VAAAWSAPPSVRCNSLSLHAVLRFRRSSLQFTSCPTLGVAFCCDCLLGACFFASPAFSGAGAVFCQLAPCCQCVVMVRCLLFNFGEPFDFGCCTLAQEMTFVVCYLPCFRQWLITHLLLAFLPFQSLFTDGLRRLAPCSSPVLWCTFSNPAPSSVC
jgi:hypothetical protein